MVTLHAAQVQQSPRVQGAIRPASAGDCGSCPGELLGSAERERPSTGLPKKVPSSARDKESLLEEVLDLKRALVDQAYHLKLHKVHASAVQQENRKLEKDLEDLEFGHALEAPRTGGPRRLRARLLGMKARLHDMQATCDSQDIELGLLRRDIRVTRCREIEIERDLFAAEIARLQKIVRRLRALYNRICCENSELQRVREKIQRLETANQRLENCIAVVHQTMERANREIVVVRSKANEAQLDAKKAAKKLAELEEHSKVLAGLLENERREKKRMERRISYLETAVRRLEQEQAAARMRAAMSTPTPVRKKKQIQKPRSPPETASPGSEAMAEAEDIFLKSVETAADEFIENVPASQPSSPTKSDKSDEESKEQHSIFEDRKESFTGKVEVAELQFLQSMEELEYGQARSKSKKEQALLQKKLLAAELAAKLAAEEARRKAEEGRKAAEDAQKAADEARRLAEEGARKAREEAESLAKQLKAMQALGKDGKRWSREQVTITLGDEKLAGDDYKVQVSDMGSRIEIDVEIKSPTSEGGGSDSARKREEARRKLEEEEVARRKRLEEEDAARRKRLEEEDAARRKKMEEEEESRRQAAEEEARRRMQSLAAQKKAMQDELNAARNEALKAAEDPFFDSSMHSSIKENIQEVLGHLENISDVIAEKADPEEVVSKDDEAGPSNTNQQQATLDLLKRDR